MSVTVNVYDLLDINVQGKIPVVPKFEKNKANLKTVIVLRLSREIAFGSLGNLLCTGQREVQFTLEFEKLQTLPKLQKWFLPPTFQSGLEFYNSTQIKNHVYTGSSQNV